MSKTENNTTEEGFDVEDIKPFATILASLQTCQIHLHFPIITPYAAGIVVP